jgi:hypothetical protein
MIRRAEAAAEFIASSGKFRSADESHPKDEQSSVTFSSVRAIASLARNLHK